jgi:protein TonB
MDMEVYPPQNFVAVSLFQENKDNKSEFRPLSNKQQRQENMSPVEPTGGNTPRKDEKLVSPPPITKEDTSDGERGSMNNSVAREAALSDVRSGAEIIVPLGYSGVKRGANTGTTSDKDRYSLIRAAISRAKIYPLLARKKKIEGTVVTGFNINDQGYPGDLKIRRSSGYEILDAAALKIVTKAAPFPKVNGEVIVPITFRLTESSEYN